MKASQSKKIKEVIPEQTKEITKVDKESEEVQLVREITKMREQILRPKEPTVIDQTNYYKL